MLYCPVYINNRPTVHYNVYSCKNKWILRALRKAGAEWFLVCGEIWFQILGPQTEKARFPNWVRVRTTKAALVVEKRCWRRLDSAVLNCTMLLRYAGPRWWWTACIKVVILNSIRAFTGSQWRRCSAGLTGVLRSSLRTSRAATFCTRCRGARVATRIFPISSVNAFLC